jgi:DNA-binding response OmpR family regulator
VDDMARTTTWDLSDASDNVGVSRAGRDRRPRVLVAEDDLLLGATIAEFLTLDGFDVTSAEDGQVALETAMADPESFDVVLSDLRMPRMDGTALILALRAMRPCLPLVVMSGNVPEDWHDMLSRELRGPRKPRLITKPMRMDELRAALIDEWSMSGA